MKKPHRGLFSAGWFSPLSPGCSFSPLSTAFRFTITEKLKTVMLYFVRFLNQVSNKILTEGRESSHATRPTVIGNRPG